MRPPLPVHLRNAPRLGCRALAYAADCLPLSSPAQSSVLVNRRRPSPRQSSLPAAAVAWRQPPLGLRWAGTEARGGGAAHNMRGRPAGISILEPSLPVPSAHRPWFFTAEGRKYWKARAITGLRTMYSVYQIRRALPGFKPLGFGREAQELYVRMNEAFARGDRSELRELVTDSMMTGLAADMKQAAKLGRYEWKPHGEFDKPSVLSAAAAKVLFEKGGPEFKLAQVTVRVNLKQSVAFYNSKNVLIGGNPNDVTNVTEYIVVERMLGKPGENWRITGKITSNF
ncbi:39S ribosomal protein L45, mitochondrial [Geranomyces variabilis]|nr:39S ribosomal protein L45, mitochondrial [Geranomyces variabilis]